MELFNKNILDTIGKKLIKKKQTIAVAESVTSGLLQFAFSNVRDASCFYQGGLTAFNIGQKCKHLQVDPVHASAVNCVSQKVAEEMAAQISVLFRSDWGVAVTGYASAEPLSENKVFAYYAITFKNKIKSKGKLVPKKSDPVKAQWFYANTIINKIMKLV